MVTYRKGTLGKTPGAEIVAGSGTENIERIRALGVEHDLSEKAVAELIRVGATPESPRTLAAIRKAYTDRLVYGPFTSLGEQLIAIQGHYTGGKTDPRLYAAASGGNASVGGDGGFAIQDDFAVDLMTGALQAGTLSSRCSEYPVGERSGSLEIATFDESSRATGSRFGGVQVYRNAEADTVTATKPKLGKWESELEDLTGIAYVTERLSQDAPALGMVFDQAFREEMGERLDLEVYTGSGAGECLGILNSPATIQVAQETGQLGETIVAENIAKIWRRVQSGSKRRGIWVFAPEAEDQIAGAMVGTSASHAIKYAAPGETHADHYLTIHGRPAYPIEQAPGVGSVGDIAFLDLSRYALIRKGTADRVESIHVRYVHNERVWKWTARVNGAPKLSAPLTPARGDSNLTVSPFVTLAERAA